MRISREAFGGVSAAEAVRRLINEHSQAKAVAAVQRFREEDPRGLGAPDQCRTGRMATPRVRSDR